MQISPLVLTTVLDEGGCFGTRSCRRRWGAGEIKEGLRKGVYHWLPTNMSLKRGKIQGRLQPKRHLSRQVITQEDFLHSKIKHRNSRHNLNAARPYK